MVYFIIRWYFLYAQPKVAQISLANIDLRPEKWLRFMLRYLSSQPGCFLCLSFDNGRFLKLLSETLRLINNFIKMVIAYLGTMTIINMVVLSWPFNLAKEKWFMGEIIKWDQWDKCCTCSGGCHGIVLMSVKQGHKGFMGMFLAGHVAIEWCPLSNSYIQSLVLHLIHCTGVDAS